MKRAIALAMAGAVVVMFAIPASAPAAWTKHHVTNTENAELEITGTDLFFETEIGGVTCTTTLIRADFEVGTTGRVTSFAPEGQSTITSQCQGRGLIGQCDMHENIADNLPWVFHTATADTVSVTTGTLRFTLSGFFCPHTLSLTPGTLTWTVAAGETNTTSTATIGGELKADGDLGNNIEVELSGTIHILGTITYGI